MIRYRLVCAQDHGFESWFRDSAAYDALAGSGRIACPDCGGTSVRKALMAPSVVTSRARAKPAQAAPPEAAEAAPAPAAPKPVALMDERTHHLRTMVRELHRRVAETADDVGRRFADEARAIHEGEAPARSIYGEATRDEVSALLDDGIPLLPLPMLPDDHH